MSAFVDTLVISGDRILLFPATTRLTDVTINSFIWDANGATAGITDGSGAWLNSLRWNDNYGTNNDWVNGYGAIFGNGGTGGSVSVASPISVKYILFREYSGTYTLGTANQTISLLQGITKESASTGASTIISPIILTSNNTFFHDSVGLLTISGVISGPYSLTKTGSGVLVSVVTHTFSGTTNINGGILQTNNAATNFPNNISINGGILNFMAANLTKTLGDGAGQYRITGGVSGFSCSGNRTISGTYAMVWGSSFFNPLVLVFFHNTATSSSLVFQPLLNLNGDGIEQYRTIAVNANLNATISGSISNSGGNPIGIKKTGIGRLILSGNNSTVDGVYEVQEGTLSVGNSNAMGTRAGIILSGGTFDVGTYNLSSPAFPALTLLANSGINMNTGRLSFANSTADWDTPNVNLTLSGRISTKKLRFGTDNTGLSANQISRTSQRLSSGAIKPVTIDAEGYIATEYNDGLWNSTTGNWSNPAIWVDGVIANGQDATMKRTGTGNRTITVDSNFTIGYIHDVSNLTLVSSGGSKLKFDVSSGYPYYLNSNQYGTVSIQADLTGDNGLEFMQLGSCFLFGNNDYTGGSVFSNGMTLIGSANAIPDHGLVFNGGAIASYDSTDYTFNSAITVLNTIVIGKLYVGNAGAGLGKLTFTYTGEVPLNGDRIIRVDPSLTAHFACAFSGQNILNKENDGKLELTGASTYDGYTRIWAGTLEVSDLGHINGSPSPLGVPTTNDNGRIIISGNAVLLYIGTGQTTDRAVGSVGTGTYTVDHSGTGLLNFTAHQAANTINSSTVFFKLQGSTSGVGEVSAIIANAGGTNRLVGLIKSGTGTWILSAMNTYTGVTTVNDGVLRVTGTIVSVTTINGGTLEGSDTDNGTSNVGSVTIANDVNAILRIGSFGNNQLNSGTLTFNGSNSRMVVDSTMNTFSKVNVTGNVTLNGVGLIFNEGITADGTYDLIDCSGSLSGTATIITNHTSKTLTLQHTGTKLQVEVS